MSAFYLGAHLAVANVRVEPGDPPEESPQPWHPVGLGRGEAGVGRKGPQEVLLDLEKMPYG